MLMRNEGGREQEKVRGHGGKAQMKSGLVMGPFVATPVYLCNFGRWSRG